MHGILEITNRPAASVAKRMVGQCGFSYWEMTLIYQFKVLPLLENGLLNLKTLLYENKFLARLLKRGYCSAGYSASQVTILDLEFHWVQ